MRILHTSDWHVGRAVRGKSRDEEHRAVLSEIVGITKEEGVDLVLIAGDIFDHRRRLPAQRRLSTSRCSAWSAPARTW